MAEYSSSKNDSKETLYSMMFFITTSSWVAGLQIESSRGSCGEEDTKKDLEEQLCQGVN